MSSCCIPGCTAQTLLVRFPEHLLLRKRWFRLIELATGVVLGNNDDEYAPFWICLAHFAEPDERSYQEPSIFSRKGDEESRISVSCCKLCHRILPTTGMCQLNGILKGDVLASIMFQTIRIRVHVRDYSGYMCKLCLVKVDIIRTIQAEFAVHKTKTDLMDSLKKPLEVVAPEVVLSNSKDGGEIAEEEDVEVEYLEEWEELEQEQVTWEPVTEEKVTKRQYIKRKNPASEMILRKVPNQGIASAKKCYICPVQFESRQELVSHQVENHHDSTKYICKECGGKRFETVSMFNNHLKYHDATERPYKCSFCPIRYCTRKTVREHVARKHEGKPVKTKSRSRTDHQCETCGKILHSIGGLRKHLAAQHEDRKFKCSMCERSFNSEEEQLNHKLWHLNKHPYRCELCQTAFAIKMSLRLHMATAHNGPDPFRCRHCAVTFRSQFKYRIHMHQLHGYRAQKKRSQYRCPLCPEIPLRLRDLQAHVAACHADEKYPWVECPLCPGVRRVNKLALAIHHKMKHRKKPAENCE